MADIVTDSGNPCSGGGHRDFTIGGRTYRMADVELEVPLNDSERDTLNVFGLRLLYQKGVSFASFAGRVLRGDEATNVKTYDIIAAGVAITKTNIGNVYVDVLPGANGQRALVDFTGCTQFRIILTANLVGTGQWGARIVRDSNNEVLFEQANLGAAGERELDTDWQTLSAGFDSLTLVRLQAKSQTTTDDPIFRRCILLVR